MRVYKLAGLLIAASVLSGCATLDGLGGQSPNPNLAYLKSSARLPGTVVMPGIQYRVLKSGPEKGEHPKLSDDVTVHYEGRMVNGEVFDSSFKRGTPSTFPLKKL
ncbi:MAG: FKBP-type peptidyl-prolyl cis-trans isomerase, partial [Asticcacaulis sp.]